MRSTSGSPQVLWDGDVDLPVRVLNVAYHEAAHAVTAEHLIPCSVVSVHVYDDQALTTGGADAGLTIFDLVGWPPVRHWAPMYWSGKWGEYLSGTYVNQFHWSKDVQALVDQGMSRWQRAVASRKAKRLVEEHEKQIHHVAFVLAAQRSLKGPELRKLLV